MILLYFILLFLHPIFLNVFYDEYLSVNLFKQYLEKGQDENYLLSMFVYQIRNLVKTKSLLQINIKTDSRMITNKLGMHPYVAQKCIQQVRNFSFDDLKKIYHQLMTIDFEIKTGKTDSKTALEMFLACLP